MGDGHQVGRLVKEWMKEAERLSQAHTLKGGGKEEIVEDVQEKVGILGYRNPKWMKETMDLRWWIWVYKDPKWIWKMEARMIYELGKPLDQQNWMSFGIFL